MHAIKTLYYTVSKMTHFAIVIVLYVKSIDVCVQDFINPTVITLQYIKNCKVDQFLRLCRGNFNRNFSTLIRYASNNHCGRTWGNEVEQAIMAAK